MWVFLVLIAGVSLTCATRRVDCTGARREIAENSLEFFQVAFRSFVDNTTSFRIGKEFMTFAALEALDLPGLSRLEILYVLEELASKLAQAGDAVDMATLWTLAMEARAAAHPDWTGALYSILQERMMNHTSDEAKKVYEAAYATLSDYFASQGCPPVVVGQGNLTFPGFHCMTANVAGPTVMLFGGFDSAAVLMMMGIGLPAFREGGFNVLVLDGPGQGIVARRDSLAFRPDWEVVVTPAVEYLEQKYNVSQIGLWCDSFGGYLCARAFSKIPSLSGVVLNGGVFDFLQLTLCTLPEKLVGLLYSEPAKLEALLSEFGNSMYGLYSTNRWAELSMHASSYFDLIANRLDDYSMQGHMEGFSNRPVFVVDPIYDSLAQNQSQILWAALPTPRHLKSILFQPTIESGIVMHSGVGAKAGMNQVIFQWLDKLFQQ